jgi:hypothetical protein
MPLSEHDIPHVVLLPTPSLLLALGVRSTKKFLEDWPGDSKVGEVVAVKYSVIV